MELILLFLLLASDPVEARDYASRRLGEAGAPAWPLLLRLLGARDPELRARAFEILDRQALPESIVRRRRDLYDARMTRRVWQLIAGANPNNIERPLEEIHRLDRILELREWSLGPLLALVEDGRADTRKRMDAIWVLERMGDPQAILPLLRITVDRSTAAHKG